MSNIDTKEQHEQRQGLTVDGLTRYGTFQCENGFREYVDEVSDGEYVKLHDVKKLLANQPQAAKLEDIEQYRQQMAGISCAAFGHWAEGDSIHPDYDTVPLRDVARLHAKYKMRATQHFYFVEALKDARVAIDVLMAHLIEVDPSFLPTKSVAWPALVAIKNALASSEAA